MGGPPVDRHQRQLARARWTPPHFEPDEREVRGDEGGHGDVEGHGSSLCGIGLAACEEQIVGVAKVYHR